MQVVSTAEAVWWPQGARVLLPTARREKEENPEAVLKRKDWPVSSCLFFEGYNIQVKLYMGFWEEYNTQVKL